MSKKRKRPANVVSVPMYEDKARAVSESKRLRMKLGTYLREAVRHFWGAQSQLDGRGDGK